MGNSFHAGPEGPFSLKDLRSGIDRREWRIPQSLSLQRHLEFIEGIGQGEILSMELDVSNLVMDGLDDSITQVEPIIVRCDNDLRSLTHSTSTIS